MHVVPGRVLVVDDDPAVCKALELRLGQAGHSVHTATNGEDALLCVNAVVPDVIILDVRMGGIDGYEVCRRIRNSIERPITVIFLTGTSHAGTGGYLQQLVTQAGGDYFVTKPFDAQLLVDLVGQIVSEEHRLQTTSTQE